jgi:(S)-ureidoglycine aminohydrolase
MEISALTRSIVKANHAVIAPDGYVHSVVPGWINCVVNVLINEAMGAHFCQTLITAKQACKLTGVTDVSQIFFYVVDGGCQVTVDKQTKQLNKGEFVYVPPGCKYSFEQIAEETQILTFHKVYEPLENQKAPTAIFGKDSETPANTYLGDSALKLQVLLPDNLTFDMAVNIFTYVPGGHLPIVETHVMEHGLLFLRGEGIYMLNHEWYPVKKGDSIWMGPYCQQWFTGIGKEPAVYIYFKNVNRFPTRI